MGIDLVDYAADGVIVGTIDDGLSIMEELGFLAALLLHRTEVLLMGRAKVSKYGDGGLDDAPQCPHLARLADAGLEDA